MRREWLIPRIRSTLRRLARSERGFSVPMTLLVVVAGLGLGSAAVMASISAQQGTSRDQASKDALAAADAGAQVALYRQNKVTTTDTAKCVLVQAGSLVASSLNVETLGAQQWCPAVNSSFEDGLPAGTSFTYRTSVWKACGGAAFPPCEFPSTGNAVRRELHVVSVGRANGVSRRIDVMASARSGTGIYDGNGATGVDSVHISGSAQVGTTTTPTHAATNGQVTVESSATLCGDAYEGTGLPPVDTSHQCAGYGTFDTQISLPPVDPLDSWVNNSDNLICVSDRSTPSNQCSNTGGNKNVSWNPTTRSLDMSGSATLTLGGSLPYSFCSLTMNGSSKIIVAAGAHVTIYFDSPDSGRCNMSGNPVTQISMSGNPRLTTTSGNAGDLKILMVGSTTKSTQASMTGNPSTDSADYNTFTLYAPQSNVTLGGNPTYKGAVAAKNLTVNGSAVLVQDPGALDSNISVILNYARDRYFECTGGAMPTSPSPPNSTC